MAYFNYVIFRTLVLLVGLIPFRLMYLISDGLGWVLRDLLKYRQSVVRSNLERAFPDMTSDQRRIIERRSYQNLSDILIEGIKGFSMSDREMDRRYNILNPEVLEPFYASGKSVVGTSAHTSNWEWGAFALSHYFSHSLCVVYKPVRNKYINAFIQKSRTFPGLTMLPKTESGKLFTPASEPTAIILVADQNPPNREKAIWLNFFGIVTAFLPGPGIIAKELNIPVVYLNPARVKRGFYEVHISILVEDPSTLSTEEIVQAYAQKLEDRIKENPMDWLWSHRRWKYTRIPVNA